MYPDPFYYTGGYPMWYAMPPGFFNMPYQPGCPGGDCGDFGFMPMEGYAFTGSEPPPPPDFSGTFPA